MSDSNPIAVPQRTSLIVYDPDIFNCSLIVRDTAERTQTSRDLKLKFFRGARNHWASGHAKISSTPKKTVQHMTRDSPRMLVVG